MKKNLVIGKNSKLIKLLLDKYPTLNDNVHFISHTEAALECLKEWENIFVFSYSRKLSENIHLAQQVSTCRSSVVYISSISASISSGWLPKYPRTKLMCEKIFKDICNAKIVRLGCFEEIYSFEHVGLLVPISSLNDLKSLVLLRDQDDIIENLFSFTPKGTRNIRMTMYLAIYRLLGGNLLLLRPFDLLFKVMKLSIYGYTLKAIRHENGI